MSSKLNLLVHLNSYEDELTSNNPTLNHFKWNRELQGINIEEPISANLRVPASQSSEIVDNSLSLLNNPTEYSISLKTGTLNTYVILSDVASAFRAARNEGCDASTEITITKNGPVLTFTSTGGTPLNLIAGGVIVGDEVRIGDNFSPVNRGVYKIISLTSTSFQVENQSGASEGPVTLGVNFSSQLKIYSVTGIQLGDKADIISGFSSVTLGTYEITDVSHDYIEIYSLTSLPQEISVSNSPSAINFYRTAKQFIYLESDKKVNLVINGSNTVQLSPIVLGTKTKPAMFFISSTIYSLIVNNVSNETVNIYYVTAE
jgi:hypothetical protein